MATQDTTIAAETEADAKTEQAQASLARRRELDDLRWLLGHPQGRRIVARLLEYTGIFRTSFNHSGSIMAFNEGRRDVGLFMQAELLEASAEGAMKVLAEYKAKR